MNSTHIVGVDPGLVHTGVVRLVFEPDTKEIHVSHRAVAGTNVQEVADWCNISPSVKPDNIYIEGYRPRSNLNTDQRMVEAVSRFRMLQRSTVLNNTGIKSVVKQPLLELLGAWKFSTPTHHDDLRSAARIAVLGMLKDDTHNALLTDVVRSHLRGRTWRVHS